MYLVIEHINGNILDNVLIVYNEKDLKQFANDEYLIYSLDVGTSIVVNHVCVGKLIEITYKELLDRGLL